MIAKMLRFSRWKTVLATMIVTLAIAVPVLAADTITLMVEGEGRSASVSGASLDSVGYSHEDQTSSGLISLDVDDSSATNDGWNVTVEADDFADGDSSISASNFSISGANAPSYVEGQEIDESGGPKVPGDGATGALDSPRKVLQAEEDFGAGSYEQDLDVELLVPGQTPAGEYSSNLTVNITAGP